MRRSLQNLSRPSIGNAARHTVFSSSAFTFSTSSGNDGGGRGRGRGSDLPNSHFTDPVDNPPLRSAGAGHGRGATPLPKFSFVDVSNTSAAADRGRGRGRGVPSPQSPPVNTIPKQPIFFLKDNDDDGLDSGPDKNPKEEDGNLPSSILSVLSGGGAGRGKPTVQPSSSGTVGETKVKEENRHIKPRQQTDSGKSEMVNASSESTKSSPKLSKEEAIKKARGILSKDGEDSGSMRGSGRGKKGRGRGRGRGRGGPGRRGGREDDNEESEEELDDNRFNENNEKLAKALGPEKMAILVEQFEEAADKVIPCPKKDAYIDAMHTNYMIECEPEWLMADFCSNPDIDEKPPIPLRDALEKMKPFLMVYENIQTEKEWQEVMEETMKMVPNMEEIVDYYSGPDRITAKQQMEELQRVAKTLPESAPISVKRFTDCAVLSLQSNPGWKFDKKCQFMNKLVWEVSQTCK